MTPAAKWNALTWQERETFLAHHRFALGWSAHTWRQLPREIQAKFEVEAQ